MNGGNTKGFNDAMRNEALKAVGKDIAPLALAVGATVAAAAGVYSTIALLGLRATRLYAEGKWVRAAILGGVALGLHSATKIQYQSPGNGS